MSVKNQILKSILLATFVMACSKEKAGPLQNTTTNQLPIQSPLSGQEFLFPDLSWQFYGQPGSGFDESYVQTVARSDLFPNSTSPLNATVSIKFDTATNWIEVKHSLYYRAPLQYAYDIYSNKLIISAFPPDQNLTGKKATIKAKYF